MTGLGLGLGRSFLQGLATAKLDDARYLLVGGRYGNAYYLAGYAVELGLKAAIARQFVADVIPVKAFVNDVYTHKLGDLVGLAGLRSAFESQKAQEPDFEANWAIVEQWSEASRYESRVALEAQQMIQSIEEPRAGVFPWIQRNW